MSSSALVRLTSLSKNIIVEMYIANMKCYTQMIACAALEEYGPGCLVKKRQRES